jgi:cytidyltransferase-like protein
MDRADKVLPLDALAEAAEAHRRAGRRVVLCHGVFDLLHVGHVKHLQAARRHGDVLAVTVTPDRFVAKGPGRPAFSERHRIDALAALEAVDLVALNLWPTAVETLRRIRPHVYAKGDVPAQGPRDHSDAWERERAAAAEVGCDVVLTREETYSASALLNRHMGRIDDALSAFLVEIAGRTDLSALVVTLRGVAGRRVTVTGAATVRETVSCEVVSVDAGGPALRVRPIREHRQPGGAAGVAASLAALGLDVVCPSGPEVAADRRYVDAATGRLLLRVSGGEAGVRVVANFGGGLVLVAEGDERPEVRDEAAGWRAVTLPGGPVEVRLSGGRVVTVPTRASAPDLESFAAGVALACRAGLDPVLSAFVGAMAREAAAADPGAALSATGLFRTITSIVA